MKRRLSDGNYSSGLEVRILKNLGSTDRILKAKIREL